MDLTTLITRDRDLTHPLPAEAVTCRIRTYKLAIKLHFLFHPAPRVLIVGARLYPNKTTKKRHVYEQFAQQKRTLDAAKNRRKRFVYERFAQRKTTLDAAENRRRIWNLQDSWTES